MGPAYWPARPVGRLDKGTAPGTTGPGPGPGPANRGTETLSQAEYGVRGRTQSGQGEDEGRMDALQHLGLEFLPEAVVITHMAGVDPEHGGLGG